MQRLFSLDIDECAGENVDCEDGKYCANNPGSYSCVDCDKPCSKCSEPGTEKCTACNSGFELTEKGCEGTFSCCLKLREILLTFVTFYVCARIYTIYSMQTTNYPVQLSTRYGKMVRFKRV